MEGRLTTPDRDDLEQAYARAHALADGDRGPAASVRANVLAAAREVAAQAAAQPPLVPVAAPVSDVGRGRGWAWNQLSWRVRSGAALCALVVVGLVAVRFDASRRAGENVTVAAADAPLGVQVVPQAPPPPPRDMPAPVALPAPPVIVAQAPAPAARRARDESTGRDPERVVAQADASARMKSARAPGGGEAGADRAAAFAASDARSEPPVQVAALEPPPSPVYATAPAPVERRVVALAPPAPAALAAAPAPAAPVVVAKADELQRVEVTGSGLGYASAPGGQALRGSAEIARKVAPAALGSAIGAGLRTAPTPLHVAANADDVDALRRLLAEPGARVDALDAQGRTPLQVAVMAANVRAVRLLLAAGADPDHADAAGATPRGLARTGPSAEIAALLPARR